MERQLNIAEYLVIFIEEYAKYKRMNDIEACNYLNRFGILSILEKHYDISHTLSFAEVVNMADEKCRAIEKENA